MDTNTDKSKAVNAVGRPGLSFAEYEVAFEELRAANGAPPSQRQLRRFLGTGSNTTLARYRRRIAEEQIEDKKPLDPGSIDSELLATVQRLASQIAVDEANVAEDRVSEVQREADRRVQVAESTMEKRLNDTNLLEHRAVTAERELEKALEKLKESHLAIDEMNRVNQRIKENTIAVEHANAATNQQLTLKIAECAQLEKILDVARTNEKTAVQDAKREASLQSNELKVITKQLAASEVSKTKLHENNARMRDELKSLTKSHDEKYFSLQSKIEHVLAERDTASEKAFDAKKQCRDLTAHCTQLENKLSNEKNLAAANNKSYEATITDQKSQIEYLQSMLTKMTRISEA